jgi:hypothetical protein
MRVNTVTESGKWIFIIGAILVIGMGGFITYSVVNCVTTGCNDTDDHQDAATVRA